MLSTAKRINDRPADALSPTEIVDAKLAALGLTEDYGTLDREWAIGAVAEGRACVLTTGRYHNQPAANLCSRLNRDGEHLVDQLTQQIVVRCRDAAFLSKHVLRYLAPVNEAGEAQLECARLFVRSEEIKETERARLRQRGATRREPSAELRS